MLASLSLSLFLKIHSFQAGRPTHIAPSWAIAHVYMCHTSRSLRSPCERCCAGHTYTHTLQNCSSPVLIFFLLFGFFYFVFLLPCSVCLGPPADRLSFSFSFSFFFIFFVYEEKKYICIKEKKSL